MTNTERNIRTLVVCFVIALGALVPLRVVELNNYSAQNTMVLGEEIYNEEEVYEDEFYDEGIYEEEIFEDEDYVVEEEILEEDYMGEEEVVLPETE